MEIDFLYDLNSSLIISQVEYNSLEIKWYRVIDKLPPLKINVWTTNITPNRELIDFDNYKNLTQQDKDKFKKVNRTIDDGGCSNSVGEDVIIEGVSQGCLMFNSTHPRFDVAYDGVVVAWMPIPLVLPPTIYKDYKIIDNQNRLENLKGEFYGVAVNVLRKDIAICFND